ncbi:DUF2079 domain-containing protein [Nitratiruptor sp. YY09-18]|uniref:DUF2079 domain-containing protein n=1 Tax=Nitratiruptor sp. YY09-18 TaxID=2724901 RepID=UPI001915F438|nr:DUF2079 domain-containing protein [Nitratiruptor sp. YY09-18]BCD68791.1 hypothetical protein NitYY0918_C1708 [Nitratiruptor sp. YY09-18]
MKTKFINFLKFWIILQLLFIFFMPMLKVYTLHSHYWDFGVFDHFLYIFAKENNFYWFLKNHFRPILFLYGLGYKILPSPYLLLFLQSLAVAVSGYFVYLLTIQQLGSKLWALFLVWCFFLHPMVLYQAFWDFHTDHLLLPVLLAGFYFSLQKKSNTIILFAIIAILWTIKESAVLIALFFSLYLLFSKRYKVAIFGALASIVVWYLVTHFIGPDFYRYSNTLLEKWPQTQASPFPSFYRQWGDSYTQMVLFILSHPLKVFTSIFTNIYKDIFIFVAFAPFLIISLFAPSLLIVATPGFAMTLLSAQPEKVMIYHHYHAAILPVTFAAGIVGLKQILKRLANQEKIIMAFLFFLTLIVSWAYAPTPNGRYFYWTKINDYGYDRYIPTARTYAIKEAIHREIPARYDMSVAFPNGFYYSYLGHKRVVYILPRGIDKADFIIIDLHRIDRKKRNYYLNLIQKLKNERKLLTEFQDFYIFK